MNKLQYDDIYSEWAMAVIPPKFTDYEEEESYARWIIGVCNRCIQ